jgi:hypothetical protein
LALFNEGDFAIWDLSSAAMATMPVGTSATSPSSPTALPDVGGATRSAIVGASLSPSQSLSPQSVPPVGVLIGSGQWLKQQRSITAIDIDWLSHTNALLGKPFALLLPPVFIAKFILSSQLAVTDVCELWT